MSACNVTGKLFNCRRLGGQAWCTVVDKIAASDRENIWLAIEAGLAAACELNHVLFPSSLLLRVAGIFGRWRNEGCIAR